MGRGGNGRVELEEGWRNRNIQRSRSGDRQLAGNVKMEPYDNASKSKGGEKREEDTGKTEMESNSKEEPEALAEDFSDFGDSDDDILNQEEDSKDEGKDSKTSSRSGSPHRGGGLGRRKRGDQGVLEVLEKEKGEEAEEEVKGEEEALVESNARLADALGADWSVLLKPREERREEGAARKRWSGAEIFQRIGLSKELLGEEEYNKVLDKVNADLPEAQKVKLLSPVAGLHVALTANKEEEERLLSDFGHGARALSARADINIRRRLAGLRAPDTGLPLANPNTDMALYREAKETMAAFLRERQALAPLPLVT